MVSIYLLGIVVLYVVVRCRFADLPEGKAKGRKGKGKGAKPTVDTAKGKAVGTKAGKLVSALTSWSRCHITAITYKGVTIVNPNSKTPFLQCLRAMAAATGDVTPRGEIKAESFARARAIFAVSGGFTYASDKGKTLASAKAEIRGYVLHEFVQLKHTPRESNVSACADFAKALWLGQGTATLANEATMPVAEVIDRALRLVEPESK